MAIKLEVVTRRDSVTFGYGQIDTKLMAAKRFVRIQYILYARHCSDRVAATH